MPTNLKTKTILLTTILAIGFLAFQNTQAATMPCHDYSNPECYKSIYQIPKKFECDSGDQLLTGFKNHMNLKDSCILCSNSQGCGDIIYNQRYYLIYEPSLPMHFRVFIPPGADSSGMNIYLYTDTTLGAVARLDTPPSDWTGKIKDEFYENRINCFYRKFKKFQRND